MYFWYFLAGIPAQIENAKNKRLASGNRPCGSETQIHIYIPVPTIWDEYVSD